MSSTSQIVATREDLAMGVLGYFKAAFLVALLSAAGYYAYAKVGLPDWYWQARLPDTVEALDVADTYFAIEILIALLLGAAAFDFARGSRTEEAADGARRNDE